MTKANGTRISGVTSPYVCTGLNNGTTYYFIVTAANAAGESSESSQVSVKPSSSDSGSDVDLTTSTPIENGMDFTYSGAAYDSYYNDHWRITSSNGYMQFSFDGKKHFSFHALGSTISGISYCYIDIYVNGSLYVSDKFIDKNWTWYEIPDSNFGSGTNTVKIVLTGDTHLWLDQAQSTNSSSGGTII